MFKKQKTAVLIVFILIVIIAGLVAAIYYVNGNGSIFPGGNNPSSLKGYNQLRNDFIKIGQDQSIAPNPTYQKLIPYINGLGDTNLLEKDRYGKVAASLSYIIDLYQQTNNPKVRPLYEDLGNYAKDNTPKYYQPAAYDVFCQDPSCAQHPMPAEIANAISELNTSDINADVRDSMVMDLTNTSYIEDKFRELRFNNYLGIAIPLYESDSSFSPSLKAQKIGKELLDYLKKTYPDLYNYKTK